MKKTKILFIHHAAGWGGAPINMLNIIMLLDTSRFDVHVLLLKDSVVKEKLAENNISFTVCDSYFYKKWYTYFSHSEAGYTRPFQVFRLLKVMLSWILSKYLFAPKVLKGFSFDIVHLNSSVLSDWLQPASKQGKVVYHIQEPVTKGWVGVRYGFLRAEILRYADRVIAISKDNAERINLPDKTEIVYNFTDLPEKYIHNSDNRNVLFVGGAAKIKGVQTVAGAVPYLNEGITLNLAGHYPSLLPMTALKRIAYRILYPQAYKIRTQLSEIAQCRNVNFMGSFTSIHEIIEEQSLLISPFTVPHFSRPVMEAYAHGKPVVVSDVSGMEELVEHGVTGLIVKNRDAEGLASAINLLMSDQSLLTALGENARKKAELLYNPSSNVARVEKIYSELVPHKK